MQIKVINPNSNESVTAGLRASLAVFREDADISCVTLPGGPFGIETDEDIDSVKPLIIKEIERSPQFDAFVIACYSDPALTESRTVSEHPVYGLQESALRMALESGTRIGVLALSPESIRRHLEYIDALGFSAHLAGELPLDVSVDDAANDPGTIEKIVVKGRQLIDDHDADVLILGCAGMAALKKQVQLALAVPVIEPAEASIRLALRER